MPTGSHEIPLGHSIPAHRVHGWCSHCPGRSLAEELAAWQVDAMDRTTAPGGDDRDDEMERLRTENERMRHELEVMYGGAFDSAPTTTSGTEAQPEGLEVPCALWLVSRGHVAHTWQTHPGLPLVRCPGSRVTPAAPEATP